MKWSEIQNKVTKLQKILYATYYAKAEHAFAKILISPEVRKLEHGEKAHSGAEEQLHLMVM